MHPVVVSVKVAVLADSSRIRLKRNRKRQICPISRAGVKLS